MPDFADPDRRMLVAVDMERYSGRDNILQHRAQLAFQKIMTEACEELGFDRTNWLIQQGGDGELAILPPGASERAVVTRLTPTVDRLLREHNLGLAPEARIRLRIGVHEGLVHLDGANGYPGDAVVTVCRLVDSPQLKDALRQFAGAAVALIVSDRIHQDIVRHYQDLRPEHFQRVLAEVPGKNFEAVAWIYVPGENIADAVTHDGERSFSPRNDPKENGGGAGRRSRVPSPQPSPGGQTFQNITSHGVNAFGNGNIISTSDRPDDTESWRLNS
ncbi:hypothetical protein GCM10009848_43200 [Micromonospora lupini]|uniref:Guanylate cyclase domain-containing protein n=2 Tax=Micromonospora lupini TaxID=285679 RepID=I0L5D8_9ACTN|nr:hypothetical protein [Micromonospora lupini]CCH19035.1 Conserved hypothetical protein [Micromonospora lupini str. Lupac 08]